MFSVSVFWVKRSRAEGSDSFKHHKEGGLAGSFINSVHLGRQLGIWFSCSFGSEPFILR